jgi:hypothetical protein
LSRLNHVYFTLLFTFLIQSLNFFWGLILKISDFLSWSWFFLCLLSCGFAAKIVNNYYCYNCK